MIKKIFLISGFLALLVTSPFLFAILSNEFHLWKFARQLDQLEDLFPYKEDIIAEGAQIFVGGNSEVCSYRATRAFNSYNTSTFNKRLETNILNAKFAPARPQSKENSVDISVSISNYVVLVSIEDGPYQAGFDFRCW